MTAETHQAVKTLTINNTTRQNAATSAVPLRLFTLVLLFGAILLPARMLSQNEPSALVEMESTDRGFLLPRMTQPQRNAIQNPATGLMIFNTTSVCLEVNLGSPAAPFWRPIDCRGTIDLFNCPGAVVTGRLAFNQPASNVSATVPYIGGNGGAHPGQIVTSTGVTGLTATLEGGNFANGSGSLTYVITGIPSTVGLASFALNIGGETCPLYIGVGCGAYVGTDQWKVFLCHNLAAANTSADPFTPSWEIIGGYWQWGRTGPSSSQWLNTNTSNFAHGPTGTSLSQANSGIISGWSSTEAPNGSWLLSSPCPQGFRVPSKSQWEAVLANNIQSSTGSWIESSTNYSSGRFLGPNLMLPATGGRAFDDGQLSGRGEYGIYWSNTENVPGFAWSLVVSNGNAFVNGNSRRSGFSLRCVAE